MRGSKAKAIRRHAADIAARAQTLPSTDYFASDGGAPQRIVKIKRPDLPLQPNGEQQETQHLITTTLVRRGARRLYQKLKTLIPKGVPCYA